VVTDAERQGAREVFGADDAQIVRDHVISHALAAIARDLPDDVLFFGGTALARAYLPEGRLSEDIDLIAVGPRSHVAAALVDSLTRRLAREFGRPSFQPALLKARPTQGVSVSFPSGPRVQLQLLPSGHYPSWPFERRPLFQRYADADPAALLVPTLPAFAAWKTIAFMDRRAARDLWDLAALAGIGAFDRTAAELFAAFGPFTSRPSASTLPVAPAEEIWERDLAHQTHLMWTAVEARSSVVQAWSDVG